jgi:hypothetical protein
VALSRPVLLPLMTSSYLVGACTGRSAGFSSFRMRFCVAAGVSTHHMKDACPAMWVDRTALKHEYACRRRASGPCRPTFLFAGTIRIHFPQACPVGDGVAHDCGARNRPDLAAATGLWLVVKAGTETVNTLPWIFCSNSNSEAATPRPRSVVKTLRSEPLVTVRGKHVTAQLVHLPPRAFSRAMCTAAT